MGFIDDWLGTQPRTHYRGCEEHHIRCAVAAEIARLTAERDEARALAVWVLKQGIELYGEAPLCDLFEPGRFICSCDGTDAGILDALRRAKEASDK